MRLSIQFLIIILCATPSFSQAQFDLVGKVIDEFNMPVPYVNVGIENKNIGAATTEDGDFLFVVSHNELQDNLYVSSLGFKTYKIKVQDYLNSSEKKIVLKEDLVTLDAVVVTKFKPEEYAQIAASKVKENTVSNTHQLEILFRKAALENGKACF